MFTETILWLIIMVVLIVIEGITLGLTTIWFAGGALIAWIAALCHAPVFVQIILFVVVSVVLLIFTRPIALRYFNKDRIKTNADALIGKQAIVITPINNLMGTGTVSIHGQEWTARTSDDNIVIEEGAIVTVLSIAGVKLIVEERKEG